MTQIFEISQRTSIKAGSAGPRLDSLAGVPFEEIHRCFIAAFSDYALDMSYLTVDLLRNRAIKNGVDLACSQGAFLEDGLAGFTLVGLGTWAGEAAAFDAATGIIPAFRGKGLAAQLFDHALPELRRRGVKRFLLEVLQSNEAAVRAYEKAGFHLARPLDCFQRDPGQPLPPPGLPSEVVIRPIARQRLAAFREELDWQPSWENDFDSILRVPDEVLLFGAFEGLECQGILAFHPALRWLMAILVRRSARRRGIASMLLRHLLEHLPADHPAIRMNNVELSDEGTRALLERFRFKLYTSQYEMEKSL